MPSTLTGEFFQSIFDLPFSDPKMLKPQDQQTPFATVEFLSILESSNSVGESTGWSPYYLVISDAGAPCALLVLYKKTHSYGEYVFDHAWANAFHQYGMSYYPKLICALPFTPVSASKMLISTDCELSNEILLDFAHQQIQQAFNENSSIHYLFMPKIHIDQLKQHGCHIRQSVQFVFNNNGFTDFNDFLSSLKSRKRKSITKERQQILNSGVKIQKLVGSQITTEVISHFYYCYQSTYIKRSGHGGYLTRAFFELLLENMRDKIMIVTAEHNDKFIASALFFFDDHGLYGRYWGALEEISGLHFECCYYQGIEFTISMNLKIFNPGTQGEHKILRGFTPTYCYSAHKLAHPEFDKAVADFTTRELPHIQAYMKQTTALLPFKQE